MSSPKTVTELLIVDDDVALQQDLRAYFQHQNFGVLAAESGQAAMKLLEQTAVPVAVIDLGLPDRSGMELLAQITKSDHECEVIILTGQGTIETAVEAMKRGALDYLTKPVRMKELQAVIERAYETYQLKKKNRQLQGALRQQQDPPAELLGASAAMETVFRLIERIGPTDKTILIQGESGTGKELVAHAIHQASLVSEMPLITINCAALPDQLLESEMFGHEKGAFTGATTAKQGLFEIADGGTLFIDEIGELALPLQAKLLRTLEDGTFRRVGSTKLRRADVRLIAATNRELIAEVKAGRFREDLYYRVNVLSVSLPPLRERHGDFALLLKHFAGQGWEVEQTLIEQLRGYHWPGNVRQLKNAVERARILGEQGRLELAHFPDEVRSAVLGTSRDAITTPDDLSVLTKQHIAQLYRQHNFNKTATARALGINRRTLYRLLEKYKIDQMSAVDS